MKNLQGDAIETWMVFGEVIGVHIEEHLIRDGIYDTANAQHVMRGGGPADYFSIGPDQLFKIYRPKS
jgi:flavin reductase (DIM6/NTAB) family NADH-FMN oxidoreductase RutF